MKWLIWGQNKTNQAGITGKEEYLTLWLQASNLKMVPEPVVRIVQYKQANRGVKQNSPAQILKIQLAISLRQRRSQQKTVLWKANCFSSFLNENPICREAPGNKGMTLTEDYDLALKLYLSPVMWQWMAPCSSGPVPSSLLRSHWRFNRLE